MSYSFQRRMSVDGNDLAYKRKRGIWNNKGKFEVCFYDAIQPSRLVNTDLIIVLGFTDAVKINMCKPFCDTRLSQDTHELLVRAPS